MNQPTTPQTITKLVLKAVAFAMGVAVVVLSTLGTSTPQAQMPMLGIGLFCLALNALQEEK